MYAWVMLGICDKVSLLSFKHKFLCFVSTVLRLCEVGLKTIIL